MAKWNSEQIMADLGIILPVIAVENTGAGCEVDTDNLLLTLGGVEDKLYVHGFSLHGLDNTSDVDVDYAVVTDGLESGRDLASTDYRLARAFIDVRQYFINRGFTVVPSMGSYF